MGLLTTANHGAIELYCKTYSLYRSAQEKVEKYGDVLLIGKNKHPQVSPYYTAMNCYKDDLGSCWWSSA